MNIKAEIAKRGEAQLEKEIANMKAGNTDKKPEPKKHGRKKLTEEERKERKKALNRRAYARKKIQMQKESVVYLGSIKDDMAEEKAKELEAKLDEATIKGRELEAVKNSCDAMERKVRETFYTADSLLKNQEAKADAGKPRLSLVPMKILEAIARVREYGNKKYHSPDNWKTVSVERYRDALLRHIVAYIDDPHGVDAESGLPHLWHAACNMAFIVSMEDK